MEFAHIRETKGDRAFTIVNTTVLLLIFASVLYPLLYIVSSSFSSSSAVISGRVVLWPVEPTLDGYAAVFKEHRIWSGFGNTLIYTFAGTAINVVITIMAAYPLSRKDLAGRGVLMFVFMFTMLFTGGIIPTYLLVKAIGILDTRWALLLPGALGVFNMIIMRTYFMTTIPDELLEAAQLDGCSDWKFLRRIVLPLSGPILAVVTLFYAVGHWNQFFNALIYLKNQHLYPLQIVLRDILIRNDIDASLLSDAEDSAKEQGLRDLLKFSLIVVATFPVLLFYPFVQKHFVKGVMVGSLKG
ncbi:carbohydrate ABC transporter permease [Paenibacillus cymbidii]|uniref:carbohydrate ABC transporter permease n=1 Tax=Paenibacillus cymbidii TaxID=1639034 RepID=UPI001080F787|nr:carbohydrate ABC transporter permease [Paenibacillus cymbidii]